MVVHDAATLQALTIREMPSEADAVKALTEVAENVRALAKAPSAEAYTGPVLFEPRAAAQLLTQLLGDNLRITRRPLTAPGQAVNIQTSEFESRLNARVMPDFFDVTDDATQKTYNGKPLVGFYEYDLEGVKPKPISIIEKGVLKNVLTTRTPVRNFPTSNGHARLPGNYGARSAAIGNLFVKATESKSLTELKAQMIQMVSQSGKPYGMLVRKLDFPYSGATNELQAVVQANAQGGGAARPVSPPLLVYRVYPDGREELVRGLRFHGVSTRSLRDIVAASSETALFEFVNTSTLMALLGSGGYLAPTSVVSPGLLFDELEMDVPREQLPKPPAVAPPPVQP
jgi:predicted Zn-dependent protease